MRKDLSHNRLLANLSYYFAAVRNRIRCQAVRPQRGKGPQSTQGVERPLPGPPEALRNLGAQAAQATVVMETSMKGACKQLKATGMPPMLKVAENRSQRKGRLQLVRPKRPDPPHEMPAGYFTVTQEDIKECSTLMQQATAAWA